MLNRLYILLSVFLISSSSHAQKQNNTWIFGFQSEVDFNTGAPVSKNTSPMTAMAGSSSISDKTTGTLLFYTDGSTVYDKTNATIQNGTNIGGDNTAQQNSIIVPDPASQNKYYIFCISPDTNKPAIADKGLYYATVDMTLNGGKGAVVVKKQFLMGPSAAKLTAIQHCNGKDFWVLSIKYGTDTMYTFPLTAAGVGTPVKSSLGMVYHLNENSVGSYVNVDGQMKASPDGSHVANETVIYDKGSTSIKKKYVLIYDFCKGTGVLSNPIIDVFDGFRAGFLFDTMHGLSFSPNSKVLYVLSRALYVFPSFDTIAVWQYNLAAGNAAAILASKTTIFKAPHGNYYNCDDLQLAPNGKIYGRTDFGVLSAINNPNTIGVGCLYNSNAFTHYFNNAIAATAYCLPNVIDGNTSSPLSVKLGNDTTLCSGSSITLSPVATGAAGYLWSTGATTQNISVSTSGKYWVRVDNGLCCQQADTINVTLSSGITAGITGDTTVCKGNKLRLKATGGNTYSWSTGATTDTLTISPVASTKYIVTVSSGPGCAVKDSIVITLKPSPAISVSGGGPICAGNSTFVKAVSSANNYLWSNGSTADSVHVTPAVTTTYIVNSTNSGGCIIKDSITVKVNPLPPSTIAGNNSICQGTSGLLAASGGGTYLWNNGATTASLSVNTSGTYSVKIISPAGCVANDTLKVIVSPSPVVTVSPDDTILKGNSIQLNASGGGTYSWSPATGLDNPSVVNPVASPATTTKYIVTVTNNNGCSTTDTVTIYVKEIVCGDFFLPTAFSPNEDGHNDILYVRGACLSNLHFVIYDRWGEIVFETTDLAKGWDGVFQNKKCNSGVFVYYLNAMLPDGKPVTQKGNITLVR